MIPVCNEELLHVKSGVLQGLKSAKHASAAGQPAATGYIDD
jgi:hypothetical protein